MGGGDSVGTGTNCEANEAPGSNDRSPLANAQGMAAGAGTVTVDVGGAHVEQHIDACEHSSPCSCPHWS